MEGCVSLNWHQARCKRESRLILYSARMSNPITPEVVCRKCKAAIGASDNYCRQCGTPTAAGLAGLAAWWESPWVVLPLLFLVLGPFALPLLWRSRRFTRTWKMALSVIMLGVTLFVAWQVWHALNQALAQLLELEKLH
jgi:ribosomal protein L40E